MKADCPGGFSEKLKLQGVNGPSSWAASGRQKLFSSDHSLSTERSDDRRNTEVHEQGNFSKFVGR
jgi:hypothetical protein